MPHYMCAYGQHLVLTVNDEFVDALAQFKSTSEYEIDDPEATICPCPFCRHLFALPGGTRIL